jgi:hypothetical protein
VSGHADAQGRVLARLDTASDVGTSFGDRVTDAIWRLEDVRVSHPAKDTSRSRDVAPQASAIVRSEVGTLFVHWE